MPWFIYVVLVLPLTALLGPPKAWDGVDPLVNRGHYRPAPVSYRTWTSAPRHVDKACEFTVFALATREKLTRLRINGVEQNLDWSWSWVTTIPEGMMGSGLTVTYIDPVGGKVVAEHQVHETCWPRQR